MHTDVLTKPNLEKIKEVFSGSQERTVNFIRLRGMSGKDKKILRVRKGIGAMYLDICKDRGDFVICNASGTPVDGKDDSIIRSAKRVFGIDPDVIAEKLYISI